MQYALLILSSPDAGHSARHALMFARAVLRAGHRIECVFFFDAGVLTAAAGCEAPQDEDDLRAGWQALQDEHSLRLVACVASAHRFGVAAAAQAADGPSGFEIAGLGELIEAAANADRLQTFRD